jgi:hypothetical protein
MREIGIDVSDHFVIEGLGFEACVTSELSEMVSEAAFQWFGSSRYSQKLVYMNASIVSSASHFQV